MLRAKDILYMQLKQITSTINFRIKTFNNVFIINISLSLQIKNNMNDAVKCITVFNEKFRIFVSAYNEV